MATSNSHEPNTSFTNDSQATSINESHSRRSQRGSSSSSDSKSSGAHLDKEEISRKYARVVCVGVDNSTLCEQAFNWYLENLHKYGNYIVFVHSIELPQMYSYQEIYAPAEMWEASMRHEAGKTKDLEEKYMNKLRFNSIPGRFVIRSDKPGEAIVKVAHEYDCGMIVMGTRGLGLVRRTILGSVSEYVMHHAHIPVVVCRGTKPAGSGFTHHGDPSKSVPAAMSHTTSHVHYDTMDTRAASSPTISRSPSVNDKSHS